MQQGLLARISRSSIMEYHAFGIISYVPSTSIEFLSIYAVSQRREARGISLFDLWGPGRLYKILGRESTGVGLDKRIEGAFKPCSFAALLDKCSVCRCIKHLDSLPERNPRLHRNRLGRCTIHLPPGMPSSSPMFPQSYLYFFCPIPSLPVIQHTN